MSDNYNIRDFRNAGAGPDSSDSDKSNRTFYSCVIALPVIAALAGLGYKPLMDLRGKNVAAVQQAELNMEAKRRAENPLYALRQDLKNTDGLIDINSLGASYSSNVSPEVKARRDLAKRPLNANEFLNLIDAKAYGFTPLEMETLKYERAAWALTTCDHYDLRAFYWRKNKPNYERLDAVIDKQKTAKAEINAAKQAKQAKKAEKHFDQLSNIETKGQALAFVASGGAARHMDAIGGFGSIAGMLGDSEKYRIRARRQRFNKKGCMQVRTIVQSGRMTVKTNIRMD